MYDSRVSGEGKNQDVALYDRCNLYGVADLLNDMMISQNKLENFESEGYHIASLHFFRLS